MGWSDYEELLCVQEDGVVLIYNLYGQYQHKFSMGQEANDTKIIDAKIYASGQGTGVAVMTTHFRIFIVNNYKEPKVRLLPEIPSGKKIYFQLFCRFFHFCALYFRISSRSLKLGCC